MKVEDPSGNLPTGATTAVVERVRVVTYLWQVSRSLALGAHTGRPKRSSRTITNRATTCSPCSIQKARSVEEHQSWDRQIEKQLLSQDHQIVKQPERRLPNYRLDIIVHYNKWNTSHFNNATLRMFTYLTLLISYVQLKSEVYIHFSQLHLNSVFSQFLTFNPSKNVLS